MKDISITIISATSFSVFASIFLYIPGLTTRHMLILALGTAYTLVIRAILLSQSGKETKQ